MRQKFPVRLREPCLLAFSRKQNPKDVTSVHFSAPLFLLALAAILSRCHVNAMLFHPPVPLSSPSLSVTWPVLTSGKFTPMCESTQPLPLRTTPPHDKGHAGTGVSKKGCFCWTPAVPRSFFDGDQGEPRLPHSGRKLTGPRVGKRKQIRSTLGPGFPFLASFVSKFSPSVARIPSWPRSSQARWSPDTLLSQCAFTCSCLDRHSLAGLPRTGLRSSMRTQFLSGQYMRLPGGLSSPRSPAINARNFVCSPLSTVSSQKRGRGGDRKLLAYPGGPSTGPPSFRNERAVVNKKTLDEQDEAVLGKLPAALQHILRDLRKLPVNDPRSRMERLISLGSTLQQLPHSMRGRDTLVAGCQSIVHVRADARPSQDGGVLMFYRGSADALTTKGILQLLLRGLSGSTPEEIQQVPL
ncbi:fe-s metabolism associated domain-containing protein, partial [Cystoisospora suis]